MHETRRATPFQIALERNGVACVPTHCVNRDIKCGKHFDDYHIWNQGTVPRCDECGDVIWTFPFYSGVGLHEENLKKAQDWISRADLILIIGANGSYGNVYLIGNDFSRFLWRRPQGCEAAIPYAVVCIKLQETQCKNHSDQPGKDKL